MRAFLLFALSLVSCAARGDAGVSVRSSDATANDAFDVARAAFEKGDATAFRQLKAFLKQFPGDPLAPEAEYLVGLIGATREDFVAAARHFAAAAKAKGLAISARCFEGVALYRTGDVPAAELAFAEVRAAPGDGLRSVGGRQRALERAILDAAARSRTTDKEISSWRATLPRSCAIRVADAQIAGGAEDAGVVDAGVTTEAAVVKPATPVKVVIGVLLPLSGRAKDLGERAQMGITQAGEELSKEQPPGIAVRDTGGTPEKARAWVRELVEKEGVIAIVGPMLAAESKAAALEADKAGVPLIALTPRHDITRIGKMAFRMFTTARHEAWALASHALGVERRERIAVVHSDTAYGRAMAKMFGEVVQVDRPGAPGKKPVVVVSFRTGATDHRALARELKAAQVDAIFFSDGPRDIAPILPFLAKERLPLAATLKAKSRVRPLLLMGGKSWHTAELVAIGGELVEGAIVAAPFASGGGGSFAERFKARWGAEATYVEAFAFDAYRIVHWAMHRGKARDAVEMAGALLSKERQIPENANARQSCAAMGDGRDLYCPAEILKVTSGELKPWAPPTAP
jgi:ABC-type branched-subunit amino acid transport system substrate-binding protein